MNSQIIKNAALSLVTVIISGCAFTKWETRSETREKGDITYVSENTAQGKVLAIQSAELSPNGLLEISAYKFVYGNEYKAPLIETVTLSRKDPDPVGALLTTVVSFGAMVLKEGKELGRQTIGETKNERVTGSYIEKSREKPTGKERWDSLSEGTYEVTISSARLDPFNHTFKVGRSSLDLAEIISKIDGKKIWVKLQCSDCSDALPADLPDGYKFTPLGKEIKFEFDVQRLKTAIKNSAEEARRQAKEQERRIKDYAAEQKRAAARIAKEGDNSPDDLTCKKYGIKPNTPNYGQCRMQLDMARQQAAAAAEQQQRQYEAQQRQYEAELAARKAERQKEKDRQVGMALIGIGTGMMTGKSPAAAVSDISYPARPVPPSNTPQTQVITLPNSRPVTCTTVNNVTNCF